ncbi:MAG: hypothetical protein HY331_02995 [Chloroflexi bacterium]|nr:hypothetical protein [Chloroflexota bacterium]
MKILIDLLQRLVGNDTLAAWRVSPRTAAILFALPGVGALLMALTILDRPLYRFLTAEDSPMEWLEFGAYVVAALASLRIARYLASAGQRLPVLLYALLVVACLFVAGEEIAWGQRVFGLETPAGLRAMNHQGEITLHNINQLQTKFNVVMMLIGFYGSIGAWAIYRLSRGRNGDLVNLFVPPPFLMSFFLILFGYKFMRFAFFPDPRFTVVRFGEFSEFCLAFGMAAFALFSWRRLRLGAATTSAPGFQRPGSSIAAHKP